MTRRRKFCKRTKGPKLKNKKSQPNSLHLKNESFNKFNFCFLLKQQENLNSQTNQGKQ